MKFIAKRGSIGVTPGCVYQGSISVVINDRGQRELVAIIYNNNRRWIELPAQIFEPIDEAEAQGISFQKGYIGQRSY